MRVRVGIRVRVGVGVRARVGVRVRVQVGSQCARSTGTRTQVTPTRKGPSKILGVSST